MYTAEYFISKLGLDGHIEGGYYKELYRTSFSVSVEGSKFNIDSDRALSTTIYYLLKSGQVSKFHKLKSDEIWFYHYGCPMIIHIIDENGVYKALKLGLDLENGESPQILVPADTIFGAEPLHRDSFSLVSCMVSPGFDFRDFTLYESKELCAMFPQSKDLICRLNGSLT